MLHEPEPQANDNRYSFGLVLGDRAHADPGAVPLNQFRSAPPSTPAIRLVS